MVQGEMPVDINEEYDLKSLPQRTLTEIISLTPYQMAMSSRLVKQHMDYLVEQAQAITQPELRDKTLAVLRNPAPTFMKKITKSAEQHKRIERLSAAGLYDKHNQGGKVLPLIPPCSDYLTAPQPFISAPGSGYFRHHAYPGGLAVHTSVNLRSSLALRQIYRESYGIHLKADILIAAQILHDCQKPWVLQWLENGRILPQATLAFTGSHHVFGLAEAMTRGFPPEVVIAQACAHNHLATRSAENIIVGWIRAAGILAGIDPVREGYLEPGGRMLIRPRYLENCLIHLGDHNWVVSLPASQWSSPLLEKIAVQDFSLTEKNLKEKEFYQLRNYIFSQVTTLLFYHAYAAGGEVAVRHLVSRLVRRE